MCIHDLLSALVNRKGKVALGIPPPLKHLESYNQDGLLLHLWLLFATTLICLSSRKLLVFPLICPKIGDIVPWILQSFKTVINCTRYKVLNLRLKRFIGQWICISISSKYSCMYATVHPVTPPPPSYFGSQVSYIWRTAISMSDLLFHLSLPKRFNYRGLSMNLPNDALTIFWRKGNTVMSSVRHNKRLPSQ